ncbi:endospore germination permease [Bacillus sp. AFS017336]|uniref:GerAB/ArcD/ProY family transporter n=1 Tax=Bacillus sp. AFS017336 TaxID=2033489 RepID=UPI000BEFAB38|nr:endospore germination permease [Bacillus sp. AFS017336]PEL13859.1 hypothetical protein CN601_02850 [Bacillus sp. AFS017336]
MIPKNTSISRFQAYFFIVQTQLGIGILSLPNAVQRIAKGDGWISSIIAGIAVQLTLIVYILLLRRYPNNTYPEIIQKVFGRFLGKFCNIFIFLYFILTGSLALKLFIICINLWLLPLTPIWIISMVILMACIYLTISELRVIARFFVLASFLIGLLLFLSLLTFNLPKDVQYILPIGSSGIKHIFLGSHKSLVSMLGFEGILFIYPFIQNREKGVFKTVTLSNLSITTIYTYFIFLCLISFAPAQLPMIRDPLLFLFEGLSYEMIDRVDLLFLSVWIVPMSTSVIAYLYFSVKSISKVKTYKTVLWINGVLIYCISILPMDEKKIDIFSKLVTYLSYIVVFALPFILLCFSVLINKYKASENT